jgi:hypothetical protein
MHLSDYFLVLKRKNQKPFIHTLDEQTRQQFDFFNDLKKTDITAKTTKRCLDKAINEMISHQPPEIKNNLNWFNIWPNNDLGWTGPHLSDHEINHFEAIEALFRTSWAKKPENWKIIQERQIIGSDSVSGFVMTIGPPSIPDMFVVKSPRMFDNNGKPKNDSEGEIRYEYFVGKIVCNQIRKKFLPNFPYYFGLMECSSMTQNKDLTNWCKMGSDTQLIMENIRNSQVFSRWFWSQSVSENVNIIAQVFNAILHAFLNFEFSHNDLHLMNLMIRPAHFPWMINLEEDLGILSVRNVGVIIDMGRSTFKYKDQFSSIPLMFNPIYSSSVNYSRPVNDLIKFVAVIYYHIIKYEVHNRISEDIKKLKVVLSDIFTQFQDLLRSENFQIQLYPTLEEYALRSSATWWNLPVEDPTVSFENEVFLKKLVSLCFSKVFAPFLKDQWNLSSCPINASLVENQFKSFLTASRMNESTNGNETPPKKRKMEEPDLSSDNELFLNEITFDTDNFFSQSPDPFNES